MKIVKKITDGCCTIKDKFQAIFTRLDEVDNVVNEQEQKFVKRKIQGVPGISMAELPNGTGPGNVIVLHRQVLPGERITLHGILPDGTPDYGSVPASSGEWHNLGVFPPGQLPTPSVEEQAGVVVAFERQTNNMVTLYAWDNQNDQWNELALMDMADYQLTDNLSQSVGDTDSSHYPSSKVLSDTYIALSDAIAMINNMKVDKITTVPPAGQFNVYVHDSTGKDAYIRAAAEPTNNYGLATRSGAGQLRTSTPTSADHCASKGYVDTALAGKVSVAGTGTYKRCYIVNENGTQSNWDFSSGETANHIVQRLSSGQIVSVDPVNMNHLANKRYVDNRTPTLFSHSFKIGLSTGGFISCRLINKEANPTSTIGNFISFLYNLQHRGTDSMLNASGISSSTIALSSIAIGIYANSTSSFGFVGANGIAYPATISSLMRTSRII